MKKLLIALLLFALLAPTAVYAETEGVTFTYNDEGDGYVSLTGVEGFNGGDLEIPAFIDGKTVRSIADKSFMLIPSLTSVSFPETLVSIGTYAFSDCAELTQIFLPSSLETLGEYAFAACDIKEIELGIYLRYIAPKAFDGNKDLKFYVTEGTVGYDFVTENKLPHEVKKQAADFEITYTVDEKGNATVTGGKNFVAGNITIPLTTPEGHPVVAIADGAFRGYPTVTEIKVCENVVSIGKDVFADCPRLESISMGDAPVKTIGDGAFRGCKMLAEVTLPDTLEYVGNWAFAECILGYVDLSANIKEMGHYAFDNNPDIRFVVKKGSYAEVFVMDREYHYDAVGEDGAVTEHNVRRTKRIVSVVLAIVIVAAELFVAVASVDKYKKEKKKLYKSRHIR